jgi:hypothetical protein
VTLPSTADAMAAHRRIGRWSALGVFFLGVTYVLTGAIGWALGDRTKGLELVDPALAILEVLLIIVVPFMIAMMAAVHACAPPERKVWSLTSLVFMALAGGLTAAIHFVQLTIVRHLPVGAVPGLTQILSFKWPSVSFALDLFAWDVLFGLSMLCGAMVFDTRGRARAVRMAMMTSAVLCLIGTIGPASGDLRFQILAIAGYAFVFPIACLLLARLFRTATGRQ